MLLQKKMKNQFRIPFDNAMEILTDSLDIYKLSTVIYCKHENKPQNIIIQCPQTIHSLAVRPSALCFGRRVHKKWPAARRPTSDMGIH